MNLLEFERAVKTVNRDMWVKRSTFVNAQGFQEVYEVWHKDNYGDPYVCIVHDTRAAKRQPDHREVQTLMEGEFIRKNRLQLQMLKQIREMNKGVEERKERKLDSDCDALAKEVTKTFQKIADETGARTPSRPTSNDPGWSNKFVSAGIPN
jgi:hypothetical protein